jgi:hypothetical protein
LLNSCEYHPCKSGLQTRVVVTKWVEGTTSDVLTQHYCSKLHMVLHTLEAYAEEKRRTGSKIIRQMSRMAASIVKKLVAQGEKEWKAAAK